MTTPSVTPVTHEHLTRTVAQQVAEDAARAEAQRIERLKTALGNGAKFMQGSAILAERIGR